MSAALLGIDLGSTRTKVALVTAEGQLLGLARADHAFDVDPAAGRAEQDADAWWAGLARAVRAVIAEGVVTPDAICVAGQGPTLVAADAAGQPVRPAITWLDTRSTAERGRLERLTGVRGWSLGVLPAAAWLERTDRASASRARWYLNSWEALTLRLTGVAATTIVPGAAAIAPSIIEAAGIAPDRIAPAVATGSVVGSVHEEAAAHVGVARGTPVVAGLVDAFASFHGARMLEPGDAIDVGGAAGGFGVYADRPVNASGSFTTPAPLPGLYSVGGAMAATGAALDWFAGKVLGGAPIPQLLEEAAAIPPGADGLVFLPYLAGERSPLWDPSARGAFVGLTLRHGRAHLARAIIEAAALAIRHVAAPIQDAGIEIRAMRACGGPAGDDGWNQIKADVTGFVVEVPRVREATAVGAAIVAAAGVGVHPDLPMAIRAMTAIERRFEPDTSRARTYDRVYEAYVGLYPAISDALSRRPRPAAGAGAAGSGAAA
jgi:xylulokinase